MNITKEEMDKIEKILKRVEERSAEEREKKILRVTSAEEAEKCIRKYRNKPISFGENISLYDAVSSDSRERFGFVGTMIHILAEIHLRLITGGSNLEFVSPEEVGLIMAGLSDIIPKAEQVKWSAYQRRLTIRFAGSTLLTCEGRMEIPVDLSFKVTGGIDAIVKDKNGKIVVIDHKTARRPENKGFWKTKLQIISYAFAASEKYNLLPSDKVSVFIGLVNHKEDIEEELKVASNEKIVMYRYKRLEEIINSQDNTATPGNHCKYCEVKNCDGRERIPGYTLKML